MRVLVVSQYFWPEDFSINVVVKGLHARGVQVEVLTGLPNYPSGRFSQGYSVLGPWSDSFEGCRVLRVPMIPRGRDGKGWRLALNYLSYAVSATVEGAVRCRGRYDAILVYEPSPITVGLPAVGIKALTKTPVLFWVLDLWPESLIATNAIRNQGVLNGVAGFARFLYARSDLVLVSSRPYADAIANLGIERERIRYCPQPVADFFRPMGAPATLRKELGLPTGFIAMFAGNVGVSQGMSNLLSAAERLREEKAIQWIVLGEGRDLERLRGEVRDRRLDGCFHLLGRRPPESMPRYFAAADAMLVNLRRDSLLEGVLPAKVQAYMACGRPIVAAIDGEGARVIAESGCGLAVPTGDPDQLADAVRKVFNESEVTRCRMAERARTYFEANFSSEKIIDDIMRWVEEVGKAR